MTERFVSNNGIQIHTLNSESSSQFRIVFVPGMFGIADHWREEFKSLSDYSLTAMSVRGRGKSTFTKSGHSFLDSIKIINYFKLTTS